MTLAASLWNHIKDAEHAVADKVRGVWASAKPHVVAFYKQEKEALKKGGAHLREFYQAKKHELIDHLHEEKKAIDHHHAAGHITSDERAQAIARIAATTADLHRRHEQNLAGMHKPQESYTQIPDADVNRHEPLGLFETEKKPVVETIEREPTKPIGEGRPGERSLVTGRFSPTAQRRNINRAIVNQTFYMKTGGAIPVRQHTRRTKKGIIPVCKHIRNVKKRTKKVTRRCRR